MLGFCLLFFSNVFLPHALPWSMTWIWLVPTVFTNILTRVLVLASAAAGPMLMCVVTVYVCVSEGISGLLPRGRPDSAGLGGRIPP